MKIRIRGNSIRLRLDKKDIDSLSNSGMVQEQTTFPSGKFTYELRSSDSEKGISTYLGASTIGVQISSQTSKNWCTGEDVGIYHTLEMNDGSELRIILEKDFACLSTREGEDDTHAFPNPNETC